MADIDIDMDDFNSSDIEIPETVNPYAHLGKDSIDSMLTRQFEDRVKSKIGSKQLAQVSGAPMTQRSRAMWYQRFQAFCKGTLKHKPDTVPTGTDIERHLLIIVDHIRPRGVHKDTNQISYTCIYNGLKWIVNGLQFHVKGFRLEKCDRLRLENVVATLLKEGRITKDPIYEKQWIGASIILGMAKSILIDALDCGTLSWDITICRVLSIVLQAATCSRAGDLALSKGYDPMTCLPFEHIKIKLIRKDGIERLEGLFEIAYGKGEKDDQSYNSKKMIKALVTHEHNAVCPIKLILIHALRIGAVHSNNIHDLLASTRRRVDKTIQWAHGTWPVLPAFQNRARGIIHDKPARTGNVLANLRLGAELLGVGVPVITHDVRRGAAADGAAVAHQRLKGNIHDSVVNDLGHSQKAVNMGITRKYIGMHQTDSWDLRTAEIGKNENSFGIEIAPVSFKRRKYTDREQTTKYCDDNGLDPNKGSDRRLASLKIREIEKTTHFDGQTYVDDLPTKDLDAGRGKSKEGSRIALQEQPSAINKLVLMASKQRESSNFEKNIDPELLAEVDDVLENGAGLKNLASSIEGLVTGDSVEGMGAIQEEFFDPMCCDALTKLTPPVLTLDPVDFIEYFSRVNIISSDHPPTNQVSGGSRDEWSRFQNKCPNYIHGCKITFDRISEVDRHSVLCRYTSAEAAEAEESKKDAPRPFKCDKCGKDFDKKESHANHIKKCGTAWVPKFCLEEGCDPTVTYSTQGSWNTHRMDNHGSFTPRLCPLKADCGNEPVYTSRGAFKSHLIRTHRLAGAELAKYMPGRKGADKGKNVKRKK